MHTGFPTTLELKRQLDSFHSPVNSTAGYSIECSLTYCARADVSHLDDYSDDHRIIFLLCVLSISNSFCLRVFLPTSKRKQRYELHLGGRRGIQQPTRLKKKHFCQQIPTQLNLRSTITQIHKTTNPPIR